MLESYDGVYLATKTVTAAMVQTLFPKEEFGDNYDIVYKTNDLKNLLLITAESDINVVMNIKQDDFGFYWGIITHE